MERRGQFMFAVGMALAVFAFGPARADDCEIRCGSAYCGATDEAGVWKCDDDRRSCIASCRSEQQGSGSSSGNYSGGGQATKYGAIAYSDKTTGFGYSHDYASKAAADSAAIGYCEQSANGPGDCRVLISFYNNCGALAGASNGAYGAGWGDGPQDAGQAAVQVCQQYGGQDCRVAQTVCNGG